MAHTEAESLAARLRDPELFTVGDLTRIAGLFDVRPRDLLIALTTEVERSEGLVVPIRGDLIPSTTSTARRSAR